MVTADILNSHPVKTLKSEISKTNIKGYSKLKKNEIIELMLKYKSRFSHIKKKGEDIAKQSTKPPKKIKIIRKPKIEVPKITITEPEPEKRKVFSRGGRFFKPKEPKSKLPPIPKSNIKIKLPKDDIENEPKKISDKELLLKVVDKFGDVKKSEKTVDPLIIALQDLAIDYFGSASNFGSRPDHLEYENYKLGSKQTKNAYWGDDGEAFGLKGKENKTNTKKFIINFIKHYINTGDIDIEELEEVDPKFTREYIMDKLDLKKKSPKKQDFKFDKNNITIEIKKYGSITKYEIEYYSENENTYIEMTLRKGVNNLLFLEHLSSQFDKDKPRAKKGYTRAMLCNLINMLLNKKLVTKRTKFGLIAGDIGGITGTLEKKHNIKNLVEMYKSMGFKKVSGAVEGQQKLESNVETVLKWCMGKYKL